MELTMSLSIFGILKIEVPRQPDEFYRFRPEVFKITRYAEPFEPSLTCSNTTVLGRQFILMARMTESGEL